MKQAQPESMNRIRTFKAQIGRGLSSSCCNIATALTTLESTRHWAVGRRLGSYPRIGWTYSPRHPQVPLALPPRTAMHASQGAWFVAQDLNR